MKIIFDTETTGLDKRRDEILQFSAIDEYGNTLMNEFFKPSRVKTWPEAARINGITPNRVKDCPPISERIDDIQDLFNRADELIAYNAPFDLGMLEEAGLVIPKVPITDVMKDFARVYGAWNDKYGEYRWQKLVTAAEYYGYKFPAHDSLEDVKATLFVYYSMKQKRERYQWQRFLILKDDIELCSCRYWIDADKAGRDLFGDLWDEKMIIEERFPGIKFEEILKV